MPTIIESSISTIRKLISSPPAKANEQLSQIHQAAHKLQTNCEKFITDPARLDDLLSLSEEMAAYRGKGSQNGAQLLSRIFCGILYRLEEKFPEPEPPFPSFEKARETIPSENVKWDLLAKLATRALAILQGPPSRSHQTDDLKSDAWSQLEGIAHWVRDPAWLALAHKAVAGPKNRSRERQAALGFITMFFRADEEIEKATIDLLRELQRKEKDRGILVGIMQTQIELGLNSEFGAMDVMENFDDTEKE